MNMPMFICVFFFRDHVSATATATFQPAATHAATRVLYTGPWHSPMQSGLDIINKKLNWRSSAALNCTTPHTCRRVLVPICAISGCSPVLSHNTAQFLLLIVPQAHAFTSLFLSPPFLCTSPSFWSVYHAEFWISSVTVAWPSLA